jgi:hypothetical protein
MTDQGSMKLDNIIDVDGASLEELEKLQLELYRAMSKKFGPAQAAAVRIA